uniref:Di19 C-terminal domain-containing protein n=1 Tax=Cannabis sativa TaxID=3483 RepID=A0A803QDL8_CANSA
MIWRLKTISDLSSLAPIATKTLTSLPYVRILRTTILANPKSPLRRVAIPNSQALSLLGRDLREAHLQVLLGGGGGYRSNNSSVSNAATDPLLSSLILNYPTSEAEEISKSVVANADDTSMKKVAPAHTWKSSFDPSLSYEEREKRMKQATGRAGFVQDLFLTTLLGD